MKNPILCSVALILMLVACAPAAAPTATPLPSAETPTPEQPGEEAPADLRSASISQLAAEITGDTSLVRAMEATQEALARGGVATTDLETVYVEAVTPAASAITSPDETLNLALEARDRETVWRMTMTELGRALSDFGWPFEDGSTPGEQMIRFFGVWVTEAQKDPDDTLNFAPLFIAEMAQRQVPAVDLAAGTASPDEVGLSLLELELFAAAFDRVLTEASEGSSGIHLAKWIPLNPSRALPGDPCAAAKKLLTSPYSLVTPDAIGDVIASEGMSAAQGEALEAMGQDADDFGKAMSALSIVARIWKLIALYSNTQVSVEVISANPIHKPLEGQNQLASFEARAGISEEDWKEYQEKWGELGSSIKQAIKDCLAQFGQTTFADLGDIAEEAEKWSVEWEIVGGGEHANWSPDDQVNGSVHLGRWRGKLQRETPYSATAYFQVRIDDEKAADHPGEQKTGNVKVCAEVETAEPPSLGTFVNAAKGGLDLIDALVELGAGWLLSIATPEACATLKVTWHEGQPKGWHGTITITQTIIDGWTDTTPCPSCTSSIHTYGQSFQYEASIEVEQAEIPGVPGDLPVIPEFQTAFLQGTAKVSVTEDWQDSGTNKGDCTHQWSQVYTMAAQWEGPVDASLGIIQGSYFITVDTPGAEGRYEGNYSDSRTGPPACNPDSSSSTDTDTITEGLRFGIPEMTGTVDPDNPNSISGSRTETETIGTTGTVITTITWEFTRTTQ